MSENKDGQGSEWIRRILDASRLMDAPVVRRCLDEAADALGSPVCLDEVVMPALRQIGLWWAGGVYSIAQEAMTTEAVRAWLDRRNALAPDPKYPDPILLACGPADRHTIGLEALAMLLRMRGWHCRVLGARITTVNLATAAGANAAAAVVVVSHMADGHRKAVESIDSVHRLGFRTFYAGDAFSGSASREGVPGRYLGSRIGQACLIVVDALTSA